MQIFERKRLDVALTGPGTQMTILALFIMLLAFFILMNSISNIQNDAVKKVRDSIKVALGADESMGLGNIAWIPGVAALGGTGASMQDMAGSFQSELPGLRATYIKRSGIMRMVIAANTFNDVLGLTGNRKIHPLIQQLFDTIAHPEKTQGRVYDVQLLVQYPQEMLMADDRSGLVTQQYLAMWSRSLQQVGVPADQLTVGVGDGHAGFVTLIVMPREKTESRVVTPQAGKVDINAAPVTQGETP